MEDIEDQIEQIETDVESEGTVTSNEERRIYSSEEELYDHFLLALLCMVVIHFKAFITYIWRRCCYATYIYLPDEFELKCRGKNYCKT